MNICPNSLLWELLKGIPSVFVTLVLGCIAAYIAYRQYKVSHAKLKLDLFEKRCEIYLQTANFLTTLGNYGPPMDGHAVMTFRGLTGAAEFLFADDVNDFLREVTSKADMPREQRDDVRSWVVEELGGKLAARFNPYMILSDWR